MKPEERRELLERCVFLIPEPEIRSFVRQALDKVQPEFYAVPASSSGMYHAYENNGEGGLVRHTVKAVLIGHDLAERINPEDKGIVIASCILHDIQKGVQDDNKWSKYALDHGLKAYNYLEQFDLDSVLKEPIRECARLHMYDLTLPEDEKILATSPDRNLRVRYVQIADQISSSAYASFIPGVSVKELLKAEVKGYKDLNGNERDKLFQDAVERFFCLKNLEIATRRLWVNKIPEDERK